MACDTQNVPDLDDRAARAARSPASIIRSTALSPGT